MLLKERPGRRPPRWLMERRHAMTKALASGNWRTDPPAQEVDLSGVRGLRFLPTRQTQGIVLHFHGGGFRMGCPEVVAPFAARLATRCNVEVVCPAYRLAPEHPFPAALTDAYAVIRALQVDGKGPLILSGDSAGGGLAAAMATISAAESLAVSGLVLLSPWLDLTISNSSYDENAATDRLFSRAAAEEAAELYLQGWSPDDALASPAFAPIGEFPPTIISVGEEEVLADDGRHFFERLRAAGVDARLHPIPGMEHVAVARNLQLTGAAETFRVIADFVDNIVRSHIAV